jgi:hypothetical protein
VAMAGLKIRLVLKTGGTRAMTGRMRTKNSDLVAMYEIFWGQGGVALSSLSGWLREKPRAVVFVKASCS